MKLQLPDEISSAQDLRGVILEIKEYARQASHAAIKKRVHASAKHSETAVELSPAASSLLHEWGKNEQLTSRGLEQMVNTLQDYADAAPTVTITLAAPATNGLKKTLVAWCRENISPSVLVTFQFNATILGGMVVRYRSRIFDWSFRRQVLENRSTFPEVLRRV